MATQYAAQLSVKMPSQDLLSAVMCNVGSLFFFRVGQQDAPSLAPILLPRFNSLDLVNLSDWQGYTKLQLGSSNDQPFSFHTEKDTTSYSESMARQNRDWSRKKYGTPYQKVDEQIANSREIVLELLD